MIVGGFVAVFCYCDSKGGLSEGCTAGNGVRGAVRSSTEVSGR